MQGWSGARKELGAVLALPGLPQASSALCPEGRGGISEELGAFLSSDFQLIPLLPTCSCLAKARVAWGQPCQQGRPGLSAAPWP